MDIILSLIQSYGYVFVFLFTLLEGETVVALAGFAAYQGYLNIWTVIFVAIIGAVIGDQVSFYFGRYRGKKFLTDHPNLQVKAQRFHVLIERHQNLIIIASRFMYGFRIIIPIVLGTSKVRGVRFLLLNILGAIIWAILFAFLGYIFGNILERLIGDIKQVQKYIFVGVLGGVAIVQGIIFLYKRIEKKMEKKENQEEAMLETNNKDSSG